MSHLMRYYVSCLLCRGVERCSPRIMWCIFFLTVLRQCIKSWWTPVNMSVFLGPHLTTLWHELPQHSNRFWSFLTLNLPPRSFFGFLFLVPCTCCSPSAGLVLQTFFSAWDKAGNETIEKGKAEMWVWEEGRGDGCKTGWEMQEEWEPRWSHNRETGSSTSKLNFPSQQGLARRYPMYHFTLENLKRLFRDEIKSWCLLCCWNWRIMDLIWSLISCIECIS